MGSPCGSSCGFRWVYGTLRDARTKQNDTLVSTRALHHTTRPSDDTYQSQPRARRLTRTRRRVRAPRDQSIHPSRAIRRDPPRARERHEYPRTPRLSPRRTHAPHRLATPRTHTLLLSIGRSNARRDRRTRATRAVRARRASPSLHRARACVGGLSRRERHRRSAREHG